MASITQVHEPADAAVPPDGHTHEQTCLNCGTRLLGRHCHECGQAAGLHRTVGAFLHDLLHGVVHLDGKVWRTLPLLALRPGDLTRRYIDGERARFVSPLALFLFSVFLTFAVFNSMGGPLPPSATSQVQIGMAESAKAIRSRVIELERRRAAASEMSTRRALDQQLAETRDELSLMERAERDGLLVGIGHRIVDDLPSGFLKNAVIKFNREPALTLYKLQANAYKFSWLLIPITVPLVWLLFLWRPAHWQLYDHIVFVTYSLAFQMLSIIILTRLSRVGLTGAVLMIIFNIGVTMHVYRQFRGTYGLGVFSASWRTVALTVVAAIAVTIFALVLIAIGAAG